jgi:hypothetical protein
MKDARCFDDLERWGRPVGPRTSRFRRHSPSRRQVVWLSSPSRSLPRGRLGVDQDFTQVLRDAKMSTLDTIGEALETINEAILLNYVFLPAISGVIYVIWTSWIHKTIKSAWYISLGIPGATSLILFLAEDILFHRGNENIVERISMLLLGFAYLPGFIVPFVVLIYHITKFSSTERMTRSAYLLAIPIVLTYIINWLVAWYFV